MSGSREKDPFIQKGDKVAIERGWGQGNWQVFDARWARPEDASDHRISLVLGRGSTRFKKIFNVAAMRHESAIPQHILARDLRIKKPLKLKPK